MSTLNRLMKNVSAGLGANAWCAALGLVALPILVHGLGPEGFGLTALCLSLLSTSAIGNFGLERAAAKYIAEDAESLCGKANAQRYAQTGLCMIAGLALLSSTLLYFVAPWLAGRLLSVPASLEQQADLAFRVTALGLPATMLGSFFNGILLGHNRLVTIHTVQALISTTRLGGSIVAVLAGYSFETVVQIYVVVAGLQMMILFAACFAGEKRVAQAKLKWDSDVARKLLSFGTWGTTTSALTRLLGSTDKWMLGGLVSVEAVGYYAVAREICARQTYVTGAISRAFFPIFSGRFQSSVGSFSSSYLNASRAIFVSATGLGILLACFAKPLLATWIDVAVAEQAAASMSILALAFTMTSYANISALAVSGGPGRPDLPAKAYGVALVGHIAGAAIGARVAGGVGVAVSLWIAEAVIFCSMAVWLNRLSADIRLGAMFTSTILPCIAAGAAIALPLAYVSEGHLNGLPHVLGVLVFGYLAYLALAFFATHTGRERTRIRQATWRMLARA